MKIAGVVLFLFTTVFCFAQEYEIDTIVKKKSTKEGLSFGILPAFSYNSDLGLEYALIANIYDYGKIYPNYRHSIYLDCTQSTRGSAIYRINYTSDSLISFGTITLDFSYIPDKTYPFYGFNGYDAVYNESWENKNSEHYKSLMFYNYERNLFRIKADFSFNLPPDRWNAVVGYAYRNYSISSVNIEYLNEDKEPDDKLPNLDEQPGLFELYKSWKLIPENEQNGGLISTLKFGVMYDSRKVKTNPSSGIWTDAIILHSDELIGSENTFTKFAFTYRQYFSLVKGYLNLATRVGYQSTIYGKAPFYFEPVIETPVLTGATNEGLGGSKYVRGVKQNRIIGEGVAYGTLELRYKVWKFNLLNQNFYVGMTGFVDFGTVTKSINITDKINKIENTNKSDYFNINAEKTHISSGLGLKFAMNENFVISTDFALPWNKQDGKYGLYVSMNYLF